MPHITSTLVSLGKGLNPVNSVLILSKGYVHSVNHYEEWLSDCGMLLKISTSHLRSEKVDKLIADLAPRFGYRDQYGNMPRYIGLANVNIENIDKLFDMSEAADDYEGQNLANQKYFQPILLLGPWIAEHIHYDSIIMDLRINPEPIMLPTPAPIMRLTIVERDSSNEQGYHILTHVEGEFTMAKDKVCILASMIFPTLSGSV